MPPIKPLDRISEKWLRMSSASQADYQAGIENPRVSWETATAASENSYKAGVTAAANAGRFGRGVKKAGNAKWQDGARTKGVARWAEGIRLAQSRYEAGFSPYARVIQNTTLPARGPKGDPANINRVSVLDKALRDEKLRQQGA
jgi:hypothetical protein